jgi:type IV pilus assembly protein PilN
MINLLPSARKEEIRFAKLNRIVLRYLRLVVLLIFVLGSILGGTLYYLGILNANAAADIADKKQSIAADAPFMLQAQDISDRLLAIKTIQSSQTRFSTLLDDLAKVLPQGVAIDTITLTGDDTKPVRIAVTGNSYDSMLSFRDALAQSARISGVDLESITHDTSGYHAGVVLGFKKGQAR